MNIGGATDRPVPEDIWTYVQTKVWGDGDEETAPQPPMRRRGFFLYLHHPLKQHKLIFIKSCDSVPLSPSLFHFIVSVP